MDRDVDRLIDARRFELDGRERTENGVDAVFPDKSPLETPPPSALRPSLALEGTGAPRDSSPPGCRGKPGVDQGAEMAALIARIEVFVRAHRPTLAITLRGRWSGRAELSRTAPGTVAVRIVSRRVPLSAAEVNSLRDALAQRGLKVSALTAS